MKRKFLPGSTRLYREGPCPYLTATFRRSNGDREMCVVYTKDNPSIIYDFQIAKLALAKIESLLVNGELKVDHWELIDKGLTTPARIQMLKKLYRKRKKKP